MVLTDKQLDYYYSIPDERKVKWLKDELNRLGFTLEDKSTNQSIYKDDLLTNHNPEVISFDELVNKEFPPNSWIVKGLIPKNGITCLSGKPKVGKSFLMLYLVISLCNNNNFLGEFETEQQKGVLFITKEDPPRLIQERITKLSNCNNLPIFFCTSPQLFLDSDESLEFLFKTIEDRHIEVIVIDSFRRIFHGDENSSQEIAKVHNRFKNFLEKDVTLIFIHHHGKEGFFKKEAGDKLRGSSDILAMLDSLLILETKDKEHVKITPAALRQDKPLPPFIVEFPDFETEKPTFKFVNFIEEEVEKLEQAKGDVLRILSENNQINQSEVIRVLKEENRGYGSTTVKNAIKGLLETKKLVYKSNGKEKIYFTPTTENNSLRINNQHESSTDIVKVAEEIFKAKAETISQQDSHKALSTSSAGNSGE